MSEKVVLSPPDIGRTITRLAHEIVEKNGGCDDLLLVGLHTRGVPLAKRLASKIKEFFQTDIPVGALDFTFYRDDLSFIGIQPVVKQTEIPINVTGKNIILVDDVLYTGRSVRAAMDALINLGRPRRIQLLVLIDRGHRELPIRADCVGKNIPTSSYEDVQVRLMEIDGIDEVAIIDNTNNVESIQISDHD
ncbi:MAG: bifunctional pyr operon transcriptional regulator/uracil phosphoribosyltransferase PyrR [Chloroflexi bacterium]|nr:bifunctional pyr operon transcriptional regulator/uracil phosphoribosyltransferase PyrR [Chloroflexota bacterium]